MIRIIILFFTFLLFYQCASVEDNLTGIEQEYTLSVSAESGGSVNSTGGTYTSGSRVTLTAIPDNEYIFAGWSNGATENPLSLTIDSNTTLSALFTKRKYPLTIQVEGEGTVSEVILSAGKTTEYTSGSVVRLTATPAAGWIFSEWTGITSSTTNPIDISIDNPKSLSAVFILESVANSPNFSIEPNQEIIETIEEEGAYGYSKTTYENGIIYEIVDWQPMLEGFVLGWEDVNGDGDSDDTFSRFAEYSQGETFRELIQVNGEVIVDETRSSYKRVNLENVDFDVNLFIAGDLSNLSLNPSTGSVYQQGQPVEAFFLNPVPLNGSKLSYKAGYYPPPYGPRYDIESDQFLESGMYVYIRLSEPNTPENYYGIVDGWDNISSNTFDYWNVITQPHLSPAFDEAELKLQNASIEGAVALLRAIDISIGGSDLYYGTGQIPNGLMSIGRYQYARVIIHELGHAIHDQLISNGFQNQQIISFFEGASLGDAQNDYWLNNHREFFAEMFATYVLMENDETDSIDQVDSNYYLTVMKPYFDELYNNN